jgi:type I restriction enzyme S subunit
MKTNWGVKKLGEVYDVRDGTHDSPKYLASGFPLVTSKNLKNDNLVLDNVSYISELDYISINKRSKVDKGDILFAMIGTIGNPVVVQDEPNFAIKNVALFKVPKEQDSHFLKYYLDTRSVIDKMITDAKGTTQKFVGLGYLRDFEISLPSLKEQQRIVSILEESFTNISRAKDNAEQNLKNSKELFESYLEGIFTNKNDWEDVGLMDICDQITDGSHFSPNSSNEGEFPYITVRDIDNDIINFERCKFINKKDYNSLLKNGCKPNQGDLLFSKDGTVGKVSLVDFEKDFVVLSSLAIIRPKRKIIFSPFLKYALKNPKFLQEAVGMKTGVAIRRIILKNLKLIRISFPKSIKEQELIVKRIEAISNETKRLESIYQQKINDLEELKKSILQKAFNGEL